jgi:hypothetical protein
MLNELQLETINRYKDLLKKPCSILEHITLHINPDGPGLLPGGEVLPDEHEYSDDLNIIWPAGIRDLFDRQSVSLSGEEKYKKVDEILEAFRKLTPAMTLDDVQHLESVLNVQDVLSVIDNVLRKLISAKDLNQSLMYQVCKYLLMNTRFRGVVKFCIAILGLFNIKDDTGLFKLFARHEEFTLYALSAVINSSEDTSLDWLDMAEKVTGWGRIHLVDRLVLSGRKDVREFLLKEGCKNDISEAQTALSIAESVELVKLLQKKSITRDLFRGAGIIIKGMIAAMYMEPEIFARGLDMYRDAFKTIIHYLRHAEKHAQTPADYRVIEQIAHMTKPGEEFNRVEFLRWKESQYDEVFEKATVILNDSRWKKTALKQLESDDFDTMNQAVSLADSLNIEINENLFAKVEKHPMDIRLWHLLSIRADEKMAGKLVRLSREKIQSGFFTGNFSGIYNPLPSLLLCLLDMLYNFPGVGMEIIRTALQNKDNEDNEDNEHNQIRLRALKVLNNTPREAIDDETMNIISSLAYTSDKDADEMVRVCAEHIILFPENPSRLI